MDPFAKNMKLSQEEKPFMYPGLEKKVHPKVIPILEEFRLLPFLGRAKDAFLYYLLRDGTPSVKMRLVDTNYVEASVVPGQTCGNCEFAYLKYFTKDSQSERVICSKVEDDIVPAGWCDRWQKGVV